MKVLVSRLGAYGDALIVTPLARYLRGRGDEVTLLTSDRGLEVFAGNPHVAKVIRHAEDSVALDKLQGYFDALQQAEECEAHVGLSESIEVNLALHPNSPRYKYPKHERRNVNYYEETFRIAGQTLKQPQFGQIDDGSYAHSDLKPELFFTADEHAAADYFFHPYERQRVILWGLSGSSRNKVYPHLHAVIQALLGRHDDLVVVTVGDEVCRVLEFPFANAPYRGRVLPRAGAWSFRQSAIACLHADLVVSPDTGLLHAAGCYDVPKVGLLGHTTREEITKHFVNDYSLEAEGVGCSPCHQIHYNAALTCNLDDGDQRAALCMSKGLPPERVLARIEEVLAKC